LENIKKRNVTVDYIKGIAILLVVLGHTMSVCTFNSESSQLYNVIWSLQMPLFFLSSGYLTRFSKPIKDANDLKKYFKKRTLGYLFPFAVWTFAIRGVILKQYSFLNIKNLIFHMDIGYWFLFSLWTVCIVYGFSCYVSEKFSSQIAKSLSNIFTYLIGMSVLAVISLILGLSFLCIKLTLYYMPFFYAGVLFGKNQNNISSLKNYSKFVELFAALSAIMYLLLLVRFNSFYISENLIGIFIRALTSLTGCCFVCFSVSKLNLKGLPNRLLNFIGQHSLEIYLIHDIFLSIFKLAPIPEFTSIKGLIVCVINYIITLVITITITFLLNANRFLKFLLFGKKSEVFKL